MQTCRRWISVSLGLLLAALPASAVNSKSLSHLRPKVFDIADVDYRPVPVQRNQPFYSPELRAAKARGSVGVDFVIGLKGEVVSAQVTSSTDSRLDAAALDAVKSWTYKPAKLRGLEVFCRNFTVLEFDPGR